MKYDWNCTCFAHTIACTQGAVNPWLHVCHISSGSLSLLGFFFPLMPEVDRDIESFISPTGNFFCMVNASWLAVHAEVIAV